MKPTYRKITPRAKELIKAIKKREEKLKHLERELEDLKRKKKEEEKESNNGKR